MSVRTVLFSFLARAASTTFEADPSVNLEHWAEYWRKVHGVRFIHPDESSDQQTIARLLQYDQIHRVAAGPSSKRPVPYLPPVDADGKLFDTIEGHVERYSQPTWDGVAYLQFADLDGLHSVLGAERVRLKIGPEDKAIFRDLAPLLAQQHILVRAETGSDGIVMVRTHARSNDLDRRTFQSRWLQEHGRFAAGMLKSSRMVRSYVQLHNIGPVSSGEPFFHPATTGIDGVTVLGFASMLDAEKSLLSKEYAAVLADERNITRDSAGEFWTAINFNVVEGPDA